jgi:cbb3-type cytochrome oxidase subunit 3
MPTLTSLVGTYINRYYNSYSKYAKVALVIALLIIFISIGYYAYSTYGKRMIKKQGDERRRQLPDLYQLVRVNIFLRRVVSPLQDG